ERPEGLPLFPELGADDRQDTVLQERLAIRSEDERLGDILALDDRRHHASSAKRGRYRLNTQTPEMSVADIHISIPPSWVTVGLSPSITTGRMEAMKLVSGFSRKASCRNRGAISGR